LKLFDFSIETLNIFERCILNLKVTITAVPINRKYNSCTARLFGSTTAQCSLTDRIMHIVRKNA
jgi:hypothetical protein